MEQQLSDFEIMAPVGSRESLAAAIQSGADSIYFGIEKLNMRAHSASTFTITDLQEIAETCNQHGIKSYLTVNTIIYDEDIPLMHEIVDAAKKAGISAVIASDVAVMTYCRTVGQEVHLSTQLNISNIEALRFYAQFADVVVLARELNMDQVTEIHRQAVEQGICGPSGKPIRIEMFCHGALCMAISGKCYMSLDAANRSANRGECVQICRRSYILTDAETGHQIEVDNKYLMSPKDLKTVRFIDRMMKAGVRVFKIEVSRAYLTVPLPRRRKTSGTSVCRVSSTVASGMATIKVSSWASGTRNMARVPPNVRCMWARARSISPSSVWRSSLLRPPRSR